MKKALFTSITTAFSALMYKIGKDGSLEKKSQPQQIAEPNNFTQHIKRIPQFFVGHSLNEKATAKKVANQEPKLSFDNDAITPIIKIIKINNYCSIIYSTMQRSPLAVIERINQTCIEGDYSTVYQFFEEESVDPKFRVSQSIYEKHQQYFPLQLASSRNYKKNIELIKNAYTFANSVPQKKGTTGYIQDWRKVEQYCRNLIIDRKCDDLTIISGPIYNSGSKYIDKKSHLVIKDVYINQHQVISDVPVPQKLFKIIECRKDKQKYQSTYIFNKYKGDNNYIANEVEDQTGLVFPIQKNPLNLKEYAPIKN